MKSDIQPIDLHNAVILDTETTGLSVSDEICEVSVIDALTGQPLMDTLIKPTVQMFDTVISIHGITNEMVADAPAYSEIHDQLMTIFKERNVIIYNKKFDISFIRQSAEKYNLTVARKANSSFCAMKWYAEFYGEWNSRRGSYRWQKLVNATKQQKIDISDITAHRALADCEITRRLITTVNEKIV
jgi:DNA polymerase-3 subunit epsilon